MPGRYSPSVLPEPSRTGDALREGLAAFQQAMNAMAARKRQNDEDRLYTIQHQGYVDPDGPNLLQRIVHRVRSHGEAAPNPTPGAVPTSRPTVPADDDSAVSGGSLLREALRAQRPSATMDYQPGDIRETPNLSPIFGVTGRSRIRAALQAREGQRGGGLDASAAARLAGGGLVQDQPTRPGYRPFDEVPSTNPELVGPQALPQDRTSGHGLDQFITPYGRLSRTSEALRAMGMRAPQAPRDAAPQTTSEAGQGAPISGTTDAPSRALLPGMWNSETGTFYLGGSSRTRQGSAAQPPATQPPASTPSVPATAGPDGAGAAAPSRAEWDAIQASLPPLEYVEWKKGHHLPTQQSVEARQLALKLALEQRGTDRTEQLNHDTYDALHGAHPELGDYARGVPYASIGTKLAEGDMRAGVDANHRQASTRSTLALLRALRPDIAEKLEGAEIDEMDPAELSRVVTSVLTPRGWAPQSLEDYLAAHPGRRGRTSDQSALDRRQAERNYNGAQGAYDRMLARRPKAKDFVDPMTYRPDAPAFQGALGNWRADSTAKAERLRQAETAVAGDAGLTGSPTTGAPATAAVTDHAAMEREFAHAAASYQALLRNPKIPREEAQAAYNEEIAAIARKHGALR